MLVCESTFAEADAALARDYGHLTAGQAGRIAAESGARLLVLTDFSQRYAAEDGDRLAADAARAFGGEVVMARDLARISVRAAARRAPVGDAVASATRNLGVVQFTREPRHHTIAPAHSAGGGAMGLLRDCRHQLALRLVMASALAVPAAVAVSAGAAGAAAENPGGTAADAARPASRASRPVPQVGCRVGRWF